MSLTAEQTSIRSRGVGSSEIGAVAGVNPYQSIHDVWLTKRGLATFTGNLATRMGSMIEDAIIHEYSDMMRAEGEPHETANFRTTFRHPRRAVDPRESRPPGVRQAQAGRGEERRLPLDVLVGHGHGRAAGLLPVSGRMADGRLRRGVATRHGDGAGADGHARRGLARRVRHAGLPSAAQPAVVVGPWSSKRGCSGTTTCWRTCRPRWTAARALSAW